MHFGTGVIGISSIHSLHSTIVEINLQHEVDDAYGDGKFNNVGVMNNINYARLGWSFTYVLPPGVLIV